MIKTEIVPKLSIETYNKLKECIENKNGKLFIKTVVDFYEELNKINKTFIMPFYIRLHDDWEFWKQEMESDKKLHNHVVHLYTENNELFYFNEDKCIDMIRKSGGYYKYNGNIYRLYYQVTDDISHSPTLDKIVEIKDIIEII